MNQDSYNAILRDLEAALRTGIRTTTAANDRPAGGTEERPAPPRAAAPLPEAPPIAGQAAPGSSPPFADIGQLNRAVAACESCGLCITRNHAVPGMGVANPLVLVVGEGPGAEEDRQGLPFVGNAGQYLDEWLGAIGMNRRENVYIANIVKCRPPQNRDPHPDEVAACTPYLEEQVRILQPKIILALGRFAAAFFIGEPRRMDEVHGRVFEYRGVPVVPTYHPAAVLRNPELRRPVWDDLKILHGQLFEQKLVDSLPDRKKR